MNELFFNTMPAMKKSPSKAVSSSALSVDFGFMEFLARPFVSLFCYTECKRDGRICWVCKSSKSSISKECQERI